VPNEAIELSKLIELPKASQKKYLDCLVETYKSNDIDFVIEGSEAEQYVLNNNREFLKKSGIKWISNNKKVIDICIDKEKFARFLCSHNFDHPKIFSLTSIAELGKITTYPIILKPKAQSSGSKNVYIAQCSEDIKCIIQLFKLEVKDFCFQEYMGTPSEEYTVGILHNEEGTLIGSATLNRDLTQSISVASSVKNFTNREDLGSTLVISSGISQGTMMHRPDIEAYCCSIAEKLGSTGPLNFQGRMHNGKFYIFEINPRFSGTSFMRAMSGFNEADLWIKNLKYSNKLLPFYVAQKKYYKRVIQEIIERYDD
jgi:carbamoyl-phosphate synthase large subunit